MTQQFDPLLDLLVQNGVLDKDGVDTIREEQANSGGKTVREIIVDGGMSCQLYPQLLGDLKRKVQAYEQP